MARNKLSDTKVRAAKPGWHGDGDGLWLRVQPGGTRSWVFVWIRHGRRREIGLGPYGNGARQVSLSVARAKAEEARAILGRGGDPRREMAERLARVKSRTFGELADELIETKAPTWRSEKHLGQWTKTLGTHAGALAKVPVAEVSTDDVVAVLRPIWQTKAPTATRLRGRIEAVLDYAKALGLRDGENPARLKGHLDHILGKPGQRLAPKHLAAMPWADVPAFMARLRQAKGIGPRALEFTILTAARTGETIGATWTEIDLDTGLWTVPADRMKAGQEHLVPLSAPAVELLRKMPRMARNPHVFPGRGRNPLSDSSLLAVMRRMGAGYTTHGFRSAFRDWAGDATSFPRDVAELALAHAVGDDVERAYRRASALAKRQKLMGAWAGYVAKPMPAGNVVALAEART